MPEIARWLDDHFGRHSYGVRFPSDGKVFRASDVKVPDLTSIDHPARSQSILDEAQSLTTGDRNESYGHPYEDFSRTARMWSAVLGTEVTAEQVALCMVCVKISRECHSPARDNRVDGAGYFNCLEMIHEYKQANG